MIRTHVPTLEGKDAEQFEKYANREATGEEVAFMKKCDQIYLSHCKDKKSES